MLKTNEVDLTDVTTTMTPYQDSKLQCGVAVLRCTVMPAQAKSLIPPSANSLAALALFSSIPIPIPIPILSNLLPTLPPKLVGSHPPQQPASIAKV